jgi:hypothetical protein
MLQVQASSSLGLSVKQHRKRPAGILCLRERICFRKQPFGISRRRLGRRLLRHRASSKLASGVCAGRDDRADFRASSYMLAHAPIFDFSETKLWSVYVKLWSVYVTWFCFALELALEGPPGPLADGHLLPHT